MTLTGKDVAEIARLLGESQFSSLDVQMEGFRLRIRRDGGTGGGRWVTDEVEDEAGDEPEPEGEAGVEPPPSPPPSGTAQAHGEPSEGEVDVPAPLLGNYYAAPRPGEDPFVEVGDRVEPDTVIAIIEVMKLMNSVRAGVSGTVTAVLPENGAAIEKGQAIIRVKVD
ncbi:acetyl-CoA carboxylase biotin carboxyl carrier protein [Aurantiacibacter poecillastricola]|uniref:acetyl-CoA carboxylase biotin carboxyl carrier protein n=1 Tax=Aurantiacibacter poecillastricola TaxID=3064385 RepID=UPI00273D7AAA|nr:biotin/lipoyl-containing protein [Aurantiacibacter sp. 219JJ12-13]MDP5261409.1 biotin/lipoyl-containing protein [Aurantiacibacter sp. 219JJ12-13]